ncbi:MAG: hypothetical protein MHMPM18_004859 [Marteilia pararefringens]
MPQFYLDFRKNLVRENFLEIDPKVKFDSLYGLIAIATESNKYLESQEEENRKNLENFMINASKNVQVSREEKREEIRKLIVARDKLTEKINSMHVEEFSNEDEKKKGRTWKKKK